jgi:hypothetical protein
MTTSKVRRFAPTALVAIGVVMLAGVIIVGSI